MEVWVDQEYIFTKNQNNIKNNIKIKLSYFLILLLSLIVLVGQYYIRKLYLDPIHLTNPSST